MVISPVTHWLSTRPVHPLIWPLYWNSIPNPIILDQASSYALASFTNIRSYMVFMKPPPTIITVPHYWQFENQHICSFIALHPSMTWTVYSCKFLQVATMLVTSSYLLCPFFFHHHCSGDISAWESVFDSSDQGKFHTFLSCPSSYFLTGCCSCERLVPV